MALAYVDNGNTIKHTLINISKNLYFLHTAGGAFKAFTLQSFFSFEPSFFLSLLLRTVASCLSQ